MTVQAPPVLRAKLDRPFVTRDLIPRPRLYDRLEDGVEGPVTLVVAPAGYGKSTLVSSWLEGNVRPSAWLTLDEGENDLPSFIQYFVSAVQSLYPDACPGLAEVGCTPEAGHMEKRLANELDAIPEPFTLVLDGYGSISAAAVHEIVGALIRYPPAGIHLVLISRYEPPLPLAKLRAEGRLTEIRQGDLRFTDEEVSEFLERVLGPSPLPGRMARRRGSLEGWPAGLRLLAQSALGRGQDQTVAPLPTSGRSDTEEFLGTEVISRQSKKMKEALVRCSILERFCAPLCEVVAGRASSSKHARSFLSNLKDRNLFLVPDEERRGWYRFHRFFRDLLRDTLHRELAPEEIAGLHDRASRWFETEGELAEAIRHALEGRDPSSATGILVRHRSALMNEERWEELDRCLRLLPQDFIEEEVEAALLAAWMAPPALLPKNLRKAASLLPGAGDAGLEGLRGEIDALKSREHYLNGDGKRAVKHAKLALKRLPPEARMARAMAWGVHAQGLQMSGEASASLEVIEEGWREQCGEGGAPLAAILIARCRLHWVEADLVSLKEWASRCLKLAERSGLTQSLDLARTYQALAHYHRNEIAEAAEAMPSGRSFDQIECAVTRAMVLQANGCSQEANEEASRLLDQCFGDSDPGKMGIVRALQAELAIQQGRREDALRLARGVDRELRTCDSCGFQPAITRAKLLLTSGAAEGREEAEALLLELIDRAEILHRRSALIQLHALRALLEDSRGNAGAARASLETSLDLARPGGNLRIYVDLGSPMADMLARFAPSHGLQDYVAEIRAAFRCGNSHATDAESSGLRATLERQAIPSPLTNRELEILELLAHRLSNKEIGAKLYISPETVKKHAINIYQKLHVSGRQNAVARAVSLGILIR